MESPEKQTLGLTLDHFAIQLRAPLPLVLGVLLYYSQSVIRKC
jgi:hypothetical protein